MVTHFQKFWDEAWPGNGSRGFEEYTRKKDKKKCEELWAKHKLDDVAATIISDVTKRAKYDKGWRQQSGAFLCAPLVYLRNRRWEDGDFADWRDEKRNTKSSGPDLNAVVSWILANKRLTEKQITAQWQWVSQDGRIVGVQIPDMPPLMFKSMKAPRETEAA